MSALLDYVRGGQLACLQCNPIFRVGEQGRLYSPMLREFINMVPEEVAPPVVYTAKEVARAFEHEGARYRTVLLVSYDERVEKGHQPSGNMDA